MSAPFVSLNVGTLTGQVARIKDNLEVTRQLVIDATTKAMVQFMEDTVATASQAAPLRSGDLRKSAAVAEPIVEETSISVTGGFNIGYARQVDQGGPIFSKTKLLAIPMPEILTGQGVSMYSSPLEEQGLFPLRIFGKLYLVKRSGKRLEFHWLLTDKVWQSGDDFFSNVIAQKKTEAAPAIAASVSKDLGFLGGAA